MITVIDKEKLTMVLYGNPASLNSVLNHNLSPMDILRNVYHDKTLCIPIFGYNSQPFSTLKKGESLYDLPPSFSFSHNNLVIFKDNEVGKIRFDSVGGGSTEEDETYVPAYCPLGYNNEITTYVTGKHKWLVQQIVNRLSHTAMTIYEIGTLTHDLVFALDKITLISIARPDIDNFLEEAANDFEAAVYRYWLFESIERGTETVLYTLDTIPVFNEDNLLGNPRERIIEQSL